MKEKYTKIDFIKLLIATILLPINIFLVFLGFIIGCASIMIKSGIKLSSLFFEWLDK